MMGRTLAIPIYKALLCFVINVEDEGVKMKWSCGHEGHVNLDWLRRHCYSNHSLDVRRKNCSPLLPQQVKTCYIKHNIVLHVHHIALPGRLHALSNYYNRSAVPSVCLYLQTSSNVDSYGNTTSAFFVKSYLPPVTNDRAHKNANPWHIMHL